MSVLCSIYQDGRPIEVYVKEYVSYCHLAPLDDVMLMQCFWSGLNENIGRLIPKGEMAASPETLYKMAANPEPLHKMAVTPEPPAVIYNISSLSLQPSWMPPQYSRVSRMLCLKTPRRSNGV